MFWVLIGLTIGLYSTVRETNKLHYQLPKTILLGVTVFALFFLVINVRHYLHYFSNHLYLQALENKKLIPSSAKQQVVFFEKLKKYLQKLPQLKIEIAFPPTKTFLQKVFNWLKEEMNEKLILDIAVNPSIVGGAVIAYEGKYGNFSLAKKIDELIAEKEL